MLTRCVHLSEDKLLPPSSSLHKWDMLSNHHLDLGLALIMQVACLVLSRLTWLNIMIINSVRHRTPSVPEPSFLSPNSVTHILVVVAIILFRLRVIKFPFLGMPNALLSSSEVLSKL